MRISVHAVALLWFSFASTAVEARNVPLVARNPVPVPGGKTPTQVADAIKRTLLDQDWKVTAEAADHIDSSLHARGRTVHIRVAYDADKIRFVYQGGEKLEYEIKEGKPYIDPLYLGWIDDLEQILVEDLTGEAGFAVVAEAPATTSTALPIVRLARAEKLTQRRSRFLWNPIAHILSVKSAQGIEQLPDPGKRGFRQHREEAGPVQLQPAHYNLLIRCEGPGSSVFFRDTFEQPLEVKPGLEYLVECVGHRGPEIRPQINPRAIVEAQ